MPPPTIMIDMTAFRAVFCFCDLGLKEPCRSRNIEKLVLKPISVSYNLFIRFDSDLINIKDVNHIDIKDNNLIGFGSGVYKESDEYGLNYQTYNG